MDELKAGEDVICQQQLLSTLYIKCLYTTREYTKSTEELKNDSTIQEGQHSGYQERQKYLPVFKPTQYIHQYIVNRSVGQTLDEQHIDIQEQHEKNLPKMKILGRVTCTTSNETLSKYMNTY